MGGVENSTVFFLLLPCFLMLPEAAPKAPGIRSSSFSLPGAAVEPVACEDPESAQSSWGPWGPSLRPRAGSAEGALTSRDLASPRGSVSDPGQGLTDGLRGADQGTVRSNETPRELSVCVCGFPIEPTCSLLEQRARVYRMLRGPPFEADRGAVRRMAPSTVK